MRGGGADGYNDLYPVQELLKRGLGWLELADTNSWWGKFDRALGERVVLFAASLLPEVPTISEGGGDNDTLVADLFHFCRAGRHAPRDRDQAERRASPRSSPRASSATSRASESLVRDLGIAPQ